MVFLLARSLILVVCTAASFLVLGRAPGAVTLRTRDVETEITCPCKASRDARARAVVVDREGA
jgi:hypothetical protein